MDALIGAYMQKPELERLQKEVEDKDKALDGYQYMLKFLADIIRDSGIPLDQMLREKKEEIEKQCKPKLSLILGGLYGEATGKSED